MNKEQTKERNPWTRLSSMPVYENPWIAVREDKVLKPNGEPGIYGVVSFKNKAIGIIPLSAEGDTWLVGQYRYTLDEYSWEIPMGGSPIGEEDILTTAKRELQEETGLTASQWELLGRLHTSNSVTDEEGFVFLASQLQQGDTRFEDTEILKIKRLPLTEALEWVMSGRITDAISVAGLLMLARKLGI
jgi:8-oxo-dGTP pyrophosphatase MutT (NUDIX family)